jgi:chromosome partitioning protein
MIITITNQKGGCGKTSTAVLLTLALATKGKSVLTVDCDPQGGLTAFILPEIEDGKNIFDLLMGDPVQPVRADRGGIAFDIIPADHRLDKIYATLPPFELKKAFKNMTYDYILFDTPPTVQGISRSAAIISDKIIIPADISRATIKPTLYTLDALKEIEKIGEAVLIGKEPEEGKHGFLAETAHNFIKALDGHYLGTIQKSVTMQKAVSDTLQKWNPSKIEKILNPILDTVKL